VACSGIAQGTKDKAIAEQCLRALNALPEKVKAEYFGTGGSNYFGYGTVVPELVGALAAVGDWEQALGVIRAQPGQYQEPAIVKLAKYAHSPELLPTARKIFVSRSAKSGAALVRMLVLAGQPAEAASYVSTAADDKIRDRWTNAQAEALAETGDPAAALPRANAIADPVLRARALAAVADALPGGTDRRSAPNSMWRRAEP
jgi:HEAT repeat protein